MLTLLCLKTHGFRIKSKLVAMAYRYSTASLSPSSLYTTDCLDALLAPFDFRNLPTPLLLVDCLECISPALPVAALPNKLPKSSPFSFQFK